MLNVKLTGQLNQLRRFAELVLGVARIVAEIGLLNLAQDQRVLVFARLEDPRVGSHDFTVVTVPHHLCENREGACYE